MISSSFCLIVSQAISSPSAVVVPPPKNRLSGKMPRGVCTHLSSTARLTVVTCTPTRSAICCILSGSMNSGPLSRKSFWCSMIARATFNSVFRRCSIDSISQRADWIRFWMNSRAAGSVCLFRSCFW